MKPQYQTRYELLHESYQKWLTGFTRHAVSWGVCHPNIYYFHNLTPGWVSFNGEKPEIAIVPQSLHRLIYGPDKRTTPPLDDDLIVNLCTSEHLLVHHPMLEGILLSECEPRQPGGCKLKTAPVRPVVAARPAEYVCSEDLFY